MPRSLCRQSGHNITTCLHRKKIHINELESRLEALTAQIGVKKKKEYDELEIRKSEIRANRREANALKVGTKPTQQRGEDCCASTTQPTRQRGEDCCASKTQATQTTEHNPADEDDESSENSEAEWKFIPSNDGDP